MTIAVDAMQAAVRRRVARTAVLKDDKGFDALYGQLQTAMTNAWSEAMREGIANALDRLRDLGPGNFAKADGETILRVLEASVGEEAIRAAMRGPVINLTDALYRLGAETVGQATGVAIAFGRPDLDALDVLKSGNLYWIGNSWNVRTQNLLAKTLEDYFTEGMTRQDLAARMAEDFAGVSERSQHYWEMLADHTATKTREIGRVAGYERAGVKYVQVRARMDDRTTPICRHLNGRVLAVTKLRAQADAYLDAVSRRNEPAAKAAWTMHSGADDLSNTPTSKLGKGVGSPPYHFRCRTITVAYFGSPDKDLDRWMRAAYDRERLSRKDAAAIIDRAKTASWPDIKVSRKHYGKHGNALGLTSQKAYNQSAVDLIRQGDRDVYLSIRKGALNATFVREQVSARSGKTYLAATSVDLTDNKILTHHRRRAPSSKGDEVPKQKLPGRGIAKWLFDF
jgi:SPP1 gp7 family putative phage head morphogenesis protein